MFILFLLWSGFLSASDLSCIEEPGHYVCHGSILTDAECLDSESPGKMLCTVRSSSDISSHSVSEESSFSVSEEILISATFSSIHKVLSAECVKSAACTEKYSCLFYSTKRADLCHGINPHTKEPF